MSPRDVKVSMEGSRLFVCWTAAGVAIAKTSAMFIHNRFLWGLPSVYSLI
jgi:hypothetical protein